VRASERDAAVRHLYDRMHSPSTLAANDPATASGLAFGDRGLAVADAGKEPLDVD
jgi:hypothetical protein